jgi:hypothetical protein
LTRSFLNSPRRSNSSCIDGLSIVNLSGYGGTRTILEDLCWSVVSEMDGCRTGEDSYFSGSYSSSSSSYSWIIGYFELLITFPERKLISS